MEKKDLKKFNLKKIITQGKNISKIELLILDEHIKSLERSELSGKDENRDFLIYLKYSQKKQQYHFEIYSEN
ncbi:MAG: hypothetical protein U9Q99_03080 [Nanoarchaeota archaeon]|nr:hypothetical protein [Nanoarchaeota archaeon]